MVMKYLNKLSVKIAIAIIAGFLLAGAGADIAYPCDPKPADMIGCESLEKAVMNPKDLLSNKQGSLIRFTQTFGITAIATLAVLSTVSAIQQKKK